MMKGKEIRMKTTGYRRELTVLLMFAAVGGFLSLSLPVSADKVVDNIGFGFNAKNISGFPTGAAFLTGGGAYNPLTGFLHAGGGFRCLADINQGPLSGCEQGQGVRWDSSVLNESTTFKCTGSAVEHLKTAVTDEHTAVMTADFYRHGDGNDESFTAKMFISDTDQAPDIPGIQNVWIQALGCGEAISHFS